MLSFRSSCGEVGAPPPFPGNTTGEYHLCLIIGHYKIGHCGVQLAHFFLKGEEGYVAFANALFGRSLSGGHASIRPLGRIERRSGAAPCLARWRFLIMHNCPVNGHTMMKIPVLVRSPKSSIIGRGQYLGG